MTAPPPKHRLPRVITGGKALKTDLRLEGTGRARGLSTGGAVGECDASRADHIEAARLLVDGTRKRRRRVSSRCRSARKA